MTNHNITITYARGIARIDSTLSNATTVANSVADGSHILTMSKYVTVLGITYKCTGWSDGSGDIAASGTTNTVTIVLSQTSALTWTFKYLTKCPACGEGFGADSTLNKQKKIKAVDENRCACIACGYDNTGIPNLTET